METVLAILKKSIIPAAITLGAALCGVVLHKLARLYAKTTHTVLAMGVCVRIDKNTDPLDDNTGERAVYKAVVDGKEIKVRHNLSVSHCSVRVGDAVEILVNPKTKTYIYSDNGYREYRRLRRERRVKWSWTVFLVFIFVFAWIGVNCTNNDSKEPAEVVCEEVDGGNIHIRNCHPKWD